MYKIICIITYRECFWHVLGYNLQYFNEIFEKKEDVFYLCHISWWETGEKGLAIAKTSSNPDFLDVIVNSDEIWCFMYNMKIKC